MNEVSDRRQRAMEALYDARAAIRHLPAEHDPVEIAIETATRVKITNDVMMAFLESPGDPDDIAEPLTAAFRAAGFEVVE